MTLTATDTRVGTSTWTFDPHHTAVEFKAKHMMVTNVTGRFTDVTGTIVGDLADPTTAQIEVQINAASVDTRNEQRDNHLRSADFLDVENFPTITYKSTRIERKSDDEYRVYGDLTIRGATHEIALDATINGAGTSPFGHEVLGISVTGKLNRKDFGLTWNVALETGGWLVGDTIKLDFEIEAIKQS